MDFLALLQKVIAVDLRPRDLREFHDAVYEAVKDGKLTEEEIASLELKREELGLDEEAFDMIKRELYAAAFQVVKEDKDVSENEWDEMEQIQDFLGLKDQEIASTKKELYRLRILSEIKKGNLPVQGSAGIEKSQSEVVHWSEPVMIMEKPDGQKGKNIHLGRGMSFRMGSLPETQTSGWKHTDQGSLIITNKRLIVQGNEQSEAFSLGRILDAECFINGVRIHINRRKPLLLLYKTKGNHNVIGSILLTLVSAKANEN